MPLPEGYKYPPIHKRIYYSLSCAYTAFKCTWISHSVSWYIYPMGKNAVIGAGVPVGGGKIKIAVQAFIDRDGVAFFRDQAERTLHFIDQANGNVPPPLPERDVTT